MVMQQVKPASEIQLIPFKELAPGQAGHIRNAIIRALVANAVFALKLTPDKLVVRDIRAKDDLDYTYEDWAEVTGATANAYETMSTGTMADQRWIGIFGVKVGLDCPITAIKFNIGGGDRAIWQLQCLTEENGLTGFCPSGIIISQNAPYTISRYTRYTYYPAHVVLKGVVVEPRGKVLSP